MNSNEFRELFKEQKELQWDCYHDWIVSHKREERLLDNLGHMISEIDEVKRELNFKHWKKKKEVNWNRVQEELVDVFIFFMNACDESDLSVTNLVEKVRKKQEINRKRQINGY